MFTSHMKNGGERGKGLNNLPKVPQPVRGEDTVRIHIAAWFQALSSKPLCFTREKFQRTDQNREKMLNLTSDEGMAW